MALGTPAPEAAGGRWDRSMHAPVRKPSAPRPLAGACSTCAALTRPSSQRNRARATPRQPLARRATAARRPGTFRQLPQRPPRALRAGAHTRAPRRHSSYRGGRTGRLVESGLPFFYLWPHRGELFLSKAGGRPQPAARCWPNALPGSGAPRGSLSSWVCPFRSLTV